VPIGPLRFVIAAPRFHHRHHQRDGATANFSSFLPCLDVLFGSYSDETAERFGVDRRLPDSFAGLLLAPFRRER
jgi:sterol desaturase/sphingolipid hydroxylase (fatty acid hydroxylase superfamily)